MNNDDAFRMYMVDNLRYDPDTGLFWWTRPARGRLLTKPVGYVDEQGRMRARIMGRKVRLHRLAWLMVYGHWPAEFIDHIDGDPKNNRLCNLRECTNAENQQNRVAKKGRDLPIGVMRMGNRFRAQITHGKRHRDLGCYGSPAEAHEAYLKAKSLLHVFNPRVRAAPAPAKDGQS